MWTGFKVRKLLNRGDLQHYAQDLNNCVKSFIPLRRSDKQKKKKKGSLTTAAFGATTVLRRRSRERRPTHTRWRPLEEAASGWCRCQRGAIMLRARAGCLCVLVVCFGVVCEDLRADALHNARNHRVIVLDSDSDDDSGVASETDMRSMSSTSSSASSASSMKRRLSTTNGACFHGALLTCSCLPLSCACGRAPVRQSAPCCIHCVHVWNGSVVLRGRDELV
jgi:hypothetical protein